MRKLPAVRIPLNYFWKSRCLGSVETLHPKPGPYVWFVP